jgi:Na+/H+ antiporter NhaD/arsenite permease-like protein
MLVALGGLTLSNLCVVLVLLYYVRSHPGRLPVWIPLAIFSFFIVACIAGGFYLVRSVRRHVAREGAEERNQRRATAVNGLKIGLVVWCLILLNGVRLVLQHAVPWQYAGVGLSMDFLLIVLFWTSLNRLKRSQIENAGRTPSRL